MDLTALTGRLLDTSPLASSSGLFVVAEDPEALAWRLAEQLQGRPDILLIELDLIGVSNPAQMLELTIGVATSNDDPRGELSIAGALARLSDRVGVPIVLLIAEVPRLLETGRGRDLLYELKAARDELHLCPHHGLRILATGRDAEAMRSLVRAPAAAFFGATLVDLTAAGGPSQPASRADPAARPAR